MTVAAALTVLFAIAAAWAAAAVAVILYVAPRLARARREQTRPNLGAGGGPWGFAETGCGRESFGDDRFAVAGSAGRPTVKRLACRCSASPLDGGWKIEASAFLCPDRHKQGDLVREWCDCAHLADEDECVHDDPCFIGTPFRPPAERSPEGASTAPKDDPSSVAQVRQP